MPSTPSCQSSPCTTITFFLYRKSASIFSTASSNIAPSACFLKKLRFSSSEAKASASASLLVSKSSTAFFALSILPAALILGAKINPIWYDSISLSVIPETSISFFKPINFVLFIFFSPFFAIILLSPIKSTISAIVPRHANSRRTSSTSSTLKNLFKYIKNLKESPAAQRCLFLDGQSFCFGFIMAYADGSTSWH